MSTTMRSHSSTALWRSTSPSPKSSADKDNEDDFLWTVHEAKWRFRYEQLKEFHRHHSHCFVPISKNKSLALWVYKQRAEYQRRHLHRDNSSSPLTQERILLLDQLNFCWEPVESKWLEHYQEFKEFRRQNGEQPTRYSNPTLAHWVQEQRLQYNKQRRMLEEMSSSSSSSSQEQAAIRRSPLTRQRIRKLDRLGFDWNPGQTSWQLNFAALQDYKDKHGDCCVPSLYPSNQALAHWVQSQRRLYKEYALNQQESKHEHKEGDPLPRQSQSRQLSRQNGAQTLRDRLMRNRFELLNGLGFSWKVTTSEKKLSYTHQEHWRKQLKHLQDFQQQHGNCHVPCDYKPNPSLSMWLTRQRQQYQKWQTDPSSSTLTIERIEQLNDLGFDWKVNRGRASPQQEKTWQQYYQKLKQYKQQHGNCLVTKAQDEALAKWVTQQRRLFKAGRLQLEPNRLALLEDLAFEWDAQEAQWQKHFEELQAYRKQHGHCRVPRREGSLGNWVHSQRRQFRNWQQGEPSSLTETRRCQLDDLGFTWSIVRSKNRTSG